MSLDQNDDQPSLCCKCDHANYHWADSGHFQHSADFRHVMDDNQDALQKHHILELYIYTNHTRDTLPSLSDCQHFQFAFTQHISMCCSAPNSIIANKFSKYIAS